MEDYGQSDYQDKRDEFSIIREQFDKTNVENELKATIFGGYPKKKVQEIIGTYKEMVSMMQESFEFQLKELTAERERICSERAVLKKQLQDELDKNRENGALQAQYEELMAEHENALRKLELTVEERKKLEEEYEELLRQYEELNRRQEQRQETEQSTPPQTVHEGESVKRMMIQLEEMTKYCEVMEEEQENLEEQLRSMKTIGEELGRMSEKYEKSRNELYDARRKYQRLQKENQSMNQEMESAGQIIAEIMEQFEHKEEENTELKQQLRDYRQQLMAVKKEKLEHETAYVQMMEQTCRLEEKLQVCRDELDTANRELAELRRRNKDLENNKIIRISAETAADSHKATAEGEAEEKRQRMEELLKRAESVSRRLSGEEPQKPEEKKTDAEIKISVMESDAL